jgi:ACS family sodium-dependent inorganic phosphate cotransporter
LLHIQKDTGSNLSPETVPYFLTTIDMLQNGLLSSLPYLGKYVFAVLTSALADYCLRTDRLSRTATRKIFTAFGKAPV